MKNIGSKIALCVLLSGASVSSIKAVEEMTPGTKFALAVGVGAGCGLLVEQLWEKSRTLGNGLTAAIALGTAIYYVRQSREDAVAQAIGKEYVSVSALAAVVTGVVMLPKN